MKSPMIPPHQQEIIRKLANLCELSPDVRIGQLMAHLGFLAEDMFDRSLSDIDDDQMMQALARDEGELMQRQSSVA